MDPYTLIAVGLGGLLLSRRSGAGEGGGSGDGASLAPSMIEGAASRVGAGTVSRSVANPVTSYGGPSRGILALGGGESDRGESSGGGFVGGGNIAAVGSVIGSGGVVTTSGGNIAATVDAPSVSVSPSTSGAPVSFGILGAMFDAARSIANMTPQGRAANTLFSAGQSIIAAGERDTQARGIAAGVAAAAIPSSVSTSPLSNAELAEMYNFGPAAPAPAASAVPGPVGYNEFGPAETAVSNIPDVIGYNEFGPPESVAAPSAPEAPAPAAPPLIGYNEFGPAESSSTLAAGIDAGVAAAAIESSVGTSPATNAELATVFDMGAINAPAPAPAPVAAPAATAPTGPAPAAAPVAAPAAPTYQSWAQFQDAQAAASGGGGATNPDGSYGGFGGVTGGPDTMGFGGAY